ncbi:unnamed protein product [Darwinula stevensoni]|uniref:protein-tyrosine-phosphatase n=1 Tax=Darwinula stevensoni TaxID=69355 RepID=A0A7R8X772_9CRUS|nr:unnamed protein product [Darwinula stevensoni]CAG0888867.1 unnamed protein product [Darwinula stevensoni]
MYLAWKILFDEVQGLPAAAFADKMLPELIDSKEDKVRKGSNGTLSCSFKAHPLAKVLWFRDNVSLPSDSRFKVETKAGANESVTVYQLMVFQAESHDNGTYKCEASNPRGRAESFVALTVQEKPKVTLDVVKGVGKGKLFVNWTVYDGNAPLDQYYVQYMKEGGDEWVALSKRVAGSDRQVVLVGLEPSTAYLVRVQGKNAIDMGSWSEESVAVRTLTEDMTYEPEITIKASTSQSLNMAWNPPPKTIQDFVKACNAYTDECGPWSKPANESTLDGPASPPMKVRVNCQSDQHGSYLHISWDPPTQSNGQMFKAEYKVFVEEKSVFLNELGVWEEAKDTNVLSAHNRSSLTIQGIPNTNYTIQVCAMSRNGQCGTKSRVTKVSECYMGPNLPKQLPRFTWRKLKSSEENQIFKVLLVRASERYGPICCYRVVIVRYGEDLQGRELPYPQEISVSTYQEAHNHRGQHLTGYIAEMFDSNRFQDEVIVGDGSLSVPPPQCSACYSQSYANFDEAGFSRNRRYTPNIPTSFPIVEDGPLESNSTYSGFIEVIVKTLTGDVVRKPSEYFTLLGSSDQESPRDEAPPQSDLIPILGVTLGLLVVVTFILAVCVLRRYSKLISAEQGIELSFRSSVRHMWATLRGHPEGIPLATASPPDISPIPKHQLVDAFIDRHRDSDLGFRHEFEMLPECFSDRTSKASEDPHNSAKNRYPDIKAYDQTRVFLSTSPLHPSDYINANFVKGYKDRKTFICAQGPLLGTVADFWHMIWEQKISLMVMLTNFEENGKVKCARYWPEESSEYYGDCLVSCTAEKTYSDYVLRRLRAERKKEMMGNGKRNSVEECSLKDKEEGEGHIEKDVREITHFHYLVWRDFMAPEQPNGLLKFIKRINETFNAPEFNSKGIILVHCSAGVGRTGTLVAIDSLLQELEEEGQASIFSFISELRHQRNYLVQSIKQYMFVFRALMEHAQFGDTEIPSSELIERFHELQEKLPEGQTLIKHEFQKLSEVVEDPYPCNQARKNRGKNRYEDCVPLDKNRVILNPIFSRPEDTYINASFIQGYDHSNTYIVAQDPLQSTVADFWRLIMDQGVNSIVMLSEGDCEGEDEDTVDEARKHLCPQYWPEGEEQVTHDHLKILLTKMETLPMFIKRTFTITNTKNKEEVKVTQFQYLAWEGGVGSIPESPSSLLDLIGRVSRNQEDATLLPGEEMETACGKPALSILKPPPPILVHCSGGSDRSSVFVALGILLQQLRTEGHADVFQVVRNLRSQRPQFLQHEEQYEFLYRALVDYLNGSS